ncbi:unnamed protein product, partial [Ectocarpus sp. 12 AP-2014]
AGPGRTSAARPEPSPPRRAATPWPICEAVVHKRSRVQSGNRGISIPCRLLPLCVVRVKR